VTPAVARSAAERGSVITGPAGHRPQATHRQRAVHNGAQRVTVTRRPEPFHPASPPDMARWAGAEPRWAASLEDTVVISLGTLAPGEATLPARLAAGPASAPPTPP